MSDRSATTVRIPTSRLRPAVEAAMLAYRKERWAKVDAAVRVEMSLPAPKGWLGKRFSKRPAATRDEAIERLKIPTRHGLWSQWDDIWADYPDEWKKLSALEDACALGLDAVDVSVDDVRWFKAYFTPDDRVYR